MFTFSEYIVEAKSKRDKAPAISKYNEADMKGKLFEVLTGSFLKHGENEETGLPNQFLTHYRDAETQQTPESFHEFAKNIMHGNSDVIEKGSRKPSRVQRQHIYNEVLQHAKEAAQHIRNQLAEHGHTDVNDVVWSSLADRLGKNDEKIPGDHQKFTGVHDPNSDADIMLKTKHKDGSDRYVGISLKYGEQKNPNLRNNGLENWENEAGLEKNSLLGPSRDTREQIRKYIPNHEEYKRLNELRDSGKISPSDKRKLEKAEGLMSNLQTNTSKQIVSGLQSKSGQDLLEMARRHISPQTKFEHFRLHAFVSGKENPDGVRSAAHHFTQTQDAVDNTINDFDPNTVNIRGGSGISFGVYGKRRGSNNEEPIITYGVKKSHGLHSGINTTASAPSLTKPVLNKPAEKVVIGSGTEKMSEPVVGTPAGIIKRKLGDVKPSVPMQQRRVAQTGSPFQSMARPGIKKSPPSQRLSTTGWPEYMHQGHKDNSIGGHQDSGI